MGTKSNSNITRADALAAAYAVLKEQGMNEVAEVIERMHAQLTKPRKRQPSKASLQNKATARELANMYTTGEVITSREVIERCRYVNTAAKACAVLKVAVEDGYFEKDGKQDGRIAYVRL